MLETAFKLASSLESTFSDAFTLFKHGAKVYSSLQDEQQQQSQGFVPQRVRLDSNLSAARAPLQQHKPPVGLKNPNIQAAYRYFAENVARDSMFEQVKASNYVAKRTSKIASTTPTVSLSSVPGIRGTTKSVRVSGVAQV